MFFRKAKPVGNDNLPAAPATAIISRGMTVEGTIVSDGEVQVDGMVRGSIRASICLIDSHGTVEGDVTAREVIVRGRVSGPIRGIHVHLQDGAQVDGDIVNESITVDSGAQINGAVWRSDDPLGTAEPEAERFTGSNPALPFTSPLWSGREANDYRPLTAIRPRR